MERLRRARATRTRTVHCRRPPVSRVCQFVEFGDIAAMRVGDGAAAAAFDGSRRCAPASTGMQQLPIRSSAMTSFAFQRQSSNVVTERFSRGSSKTSMPPWVSQVGSVPPRTVVAERAASPTAAGRGGGWDKGAGGGAALLAPAPHRSRATQYGSCLPNTWVSATPVARCTTTTSSMRCARRHHGEPGMLRCSRRSLGSTRRSRTIF